MLKILHSPPSPSQVTAVKAGILTIQVEDIQPIPPNKAAIGAVNHVTANTLAHVLTGTHNTPSDIGESVWGQVRDVVEYPHVEEKGTLRG